MTRPSEAAPLRAKPPSGVEEARARAIDEALAAMLVKDDGEQPQRRESPMTQSQ
jgi:hypothetical protein